MKLLPIIISLILIAAPCVSLAGDGGAILAGFTNGVNQAQQRIADEQQDNAGTHHLTQDMIHALIAQYDSCLKSNPISNRDDVFLALISKNGPNSAPDYSGPQDEYITRQIHALKKMTDAISYQKGRFAKGEITQAALSKSLSRIQTSYQADWLKIGDDSFAEQRDYCNARMQARKQEIYNEEARQTITQQHRRIENLDEQNRATKQALIASRRKLQQAKEESAEADQKKQEAEGEAEQERQQRASYR